MSIKSSFISILLIAFVILLSCCLSNKKCTSVDIPYTSWEDVEVPFKYGIKSYWASMGQAQMSIRNLDSEGGSFTVTMTVNVPNKGIRETYTQSKYIPAGGYNNELFDFLRDPTGTRKIEYSNSSSPDFEKPEWGYTITPPSKTVTKPVTRYRQEERCY